MRLANVLICILGKQGEVSRWDYLSEDWLSPLLSRLVLVLDLEVLGDEPRSSFHYFYYFVLQNQQLAGQKVYFEEHLICDCMHITMVNLDWTIE